MIINDDKEGLYLTKLDKWNTQPRILLKLPLISHKLVLANLRKNRSEG